MMSAGIGLRMGTLSRLRPFPYPNPLLFQKFPIKAYHPNLEE